MEIRQLEYFVAVAEMGSFTRAAEACHVVQTTISHAISSLEGELVAQLFVREGRRVVLTEEGRLLLDDARSIVGLVKQVEQGIRQRHETGRGTVRIGYYGNGLGEDFPAVVRRFREETGAAVVMCGAGHDPARGDLASELKHGYVDAFLIAHAPLAAEGSWADQKIVAFNRVYLVAAETDALACGDGPLHRAELEPMASSLCMFRASSMDEYTIAMRGWLAQDFGVDSSRVQWIDSMEEARLRTRCGQCRMLSFRNLDEPRFCEGDLVYRRIDGMGYLPITLVWRKADANPLIGAFAQTVRTVSSERGINVASHETDALNL